MSGSRGTRRSRGSGARNSQQARKGGSSRGVFPSGEDYITSGGRGYAYGSRRADMQNMSPGPFSRGNDDFRSDQGQGGRNPTGNRGSRGRHNGMNIYADTTAASRRNVFGNEIGRSDNTGLDSNQFPRTDTSQMDDTSQEGRQGSTGPQQRRGCYNVIAPAEKKRIQLLQQRERNMQLYEDVKAANRQKYQASGPATLGGPKLSRDAVLERLVEEQKKAEAKAKRKSYEQKKKRDAWTEERKRKEDQEIYERKERARQQDIRNEEKRKQYEMEQRTKHDQRRHSHYLQVNAASAAATKTAAWDSMNAYWRRKNGSIPVKPVTRRQSDVSEARKPRRNLDLFEEQFQVQEQFKLQEQFKVQEQFRAQDSICEGTKKKPRQRGSCQNDDYSKQKQLPMHAKTGTRQSESDAIAEKTKKAIEMKKKRDAYNEEKRRKEEEEIEAHKRKAREQAERNKARKREQEIERKAKHDQQRQTIIERKYILHSDLETERNLGNTFSKKDTRGLQSSIKAWQEEVNKASKREESAEDDDESEYEDDDYDDDGDGDGGDNRDHDGDNVVDDVGTEQKEEEDEDEDVDEEGETDEDDWETIIDSEPQDDASEYFELPQHPQQQQQQQQQQQDDEEQCDDDSELEEETEEERKARLDEERRRRNADFFAKKFEMHENLEEIISDLSSEEDVEERKKEEKGKVQRRAKHSPLASAVQQSQGATKEDDIKILRHTFPEVDIKLIEELYAQNGQSAAQTISHLSILKQSQKQEVARRENDIIKLCRTFPEIDMELIEELYAQNGQSADETISHLSILKQPQKQEVAKREDEVRRLCSICPGVDAELIEELYVQNGRSMDETARALTAEEQSRHRVAVPKEDDISRLRRMFPDIDVEIIEDLYVQTGRSVDETVIFLSGY